MKTIVATYITLALGLFGLASLASCSSAQLIDELFTINVRAEGIALNRLF